jgi:sugar (pentulose or hexulose) kinase
MQLWSDTRPLGLLAGIARRRRPAYWQRLSFLSGPGAGLARIRWHRRRYGRLWRPAVLYVGAGEYAYHLLTGVWRQDAGNALQIGCYDARRQRLTEGPLRLVGLDLAGVAPLRQGHELHGLWPAGSRLVGLPEGLPVAGPYIDHEAGYLASAGSAPRVLQCSLGTAWVGNFVLRRGEVPEGGLNLVLPAPDGPGRLVLRVMLAGSATWDWGLRTFLGRSGGGANARAEAVFRRSLLPAEGLVGLPWMTRRNLVSPRWAGFGGFLGASPLTDRADLLRALAGGLCFEFARLLRPLAAGGRFDSVALGGGAARGWQFRALLAGLFWPARVVHTVDPCAGARGTLYAFDPLLCRADCRPVRSPGERLRESILEGFDHYCRTCAAIAAGLPEPGRRLLAHPRGRSPA